MLKLSIIVPVYNVSKYLAKCLDSLLAQDLKPEEYEIIVVNDGSTDDSPAICEKYAGKYDNIKVIHRENGGLSAARNTGIDSATGDYVCFVDSDDYWEENVLNDLMQQIESDNLDVLRFKWQNVNDDGHIYNPYKSNPYKNDDYSEEVTDGCDFLENRQGTACYACMYILKLSIAKQEKFTEGIYFEDTEWTPRMLLRASRVASTSRIVYNYLLRNGSITRTIDNKKQEKVLKDKFRLIETLIAYKKTNTLKWFDRMIAATVVSISGMLSVLFWSQRKKYIKTLIDLRLFPLTIEKSNKQNGLKIILLNINPYFAIWLLHHKNK